MKKIAGILAAVLLVSTLGGCYKSETELNFNMSGGVEVTSVLLGSPEMYEAAGVADADGLIETFNEDSINLYASMYGMKETGERVEMTRVDAEEYNMSGALLRMRYKSIGDMTNSFTLINYLRATPLTQGGEDHGLKLTEERTLLGTKYTASGKIDLYGGEAYKAEYDAAEEAMKEKIKESEASITFKFPLAVSKSNADEKGFLGSKLTWVVNADAPQKEVYFTVTAVNPVILGMGIVILILLVLLLITARKKKDTPDAFYIDKDGNEIPVYDEADAEDMEEFEENEGEVLPETEDTPEEEIEVETEVETEENTEE